jgi:hypothetical protein
LFRCSNRVRFNKTIWKLLKSINNWSFIKLTMAWNQNCLKANKQRLYCNLRCMDKCSYITYPFSKEYQLYSLS